MSFARYGWCTRPASARRVATVKVIRLAYQDLHFNFGEMKTDPQKKNFILISYETEVVVEVSFSWLNDLFKSAIDTVKGLKEPPGEFGQSEWGFK